MTEDEFRALGEAQLDECYTFGADGPDTSDCSGLVQFLLARIGIHADGRSAQDQHDYFAKPAHADPIDEEDVAFGDLCFYGGDANDIHHVTIGWGGGKVLEAGLGGRSTTTIAKAKQQHAKVVISDVNRHSHLFDVFRPHGLPWAGAKKPARRPLR